MPALKKSVVCFILLATSIAYSQQVAFPTAEGGGKYTIGGRGGKVNEVTNLNDHGPGSLREAVAGDEPKTVVFRVSGTILCENSIDVGDYTTIAGQTAPGDGITIRKYTLQIVGVHVICRYFRVRLGYEARKQIDCISAREYRPIPDGSGYQYWGAWFNQFDPNGWNDVPGEFRKEHTNMIFDHLSNSWSLDECFSVYHCPDVSLQWCTLTESLNPNGHGFGCIWGGGNSSYHHNLFAHHVNRNPRMAGGAENNDVRNNVVFNWGYKSMYGGEDKQNDNDRWKYSSFNFVGNYYKPGPASGPKYFGAPGGGTWYVDGNYFAGDAAMTADNWKGVKGGRKSNTPIDVTPLTTKHTAEEAYELVLKYVGCSIKRDAIDERIMKEVASGRPTLGKNGIISSVEEAGGWPKLESLPPPTDSDHDGMPDSWETTYGLNPNNPEDRNIIGGGGYTMLELYLNSLSPQDLPFITPLLAQVKNKAAFKMPNEFKLLHANNNTITFSFPKKSAIKLELFDITGKRAAMLVNEIKDAGDYSVDYSSLNLSTGPYVCKLSSDNTIYTKNFFLVQ